MKARESPSELDRLDPAPAPAPVPRPLPRRKGPHETAVARDLKMMPAALAKSAVAASALSLALDLDAGGMTPRDKAGHERELRMCMMTLAEQAPGERKGDTTDAARARIEQTRLRVVE